MRTERTTLELNGNDEYVLEQALKLTETHGGEVSLLAMAPAAGVDALRKGLAIGAARAYHVADDALAGLRHPGHGDGPVRGTAPDRIRPGIRGRRLLGRGRGRGRRRHRGASRLPYLSDAADIELSTETRGGARPPAAPGRSRGRPGRAAGRGHGHAAAGRAAVPVAAGHHGGAVSREIVTWTLADLGIDAHDVGWPAATTRVVGAMTPPARGAATVIAAPAGGRRGRHRGPPGRLGLV